MLRDLLLAYFQRFLFLALVLLQSTAILLGRLADQLLQGMDDLVIRDLFVGDRDGAAFDTAGGPSLNLTPITSAM